MVITADVVRQTGVMHRAAETAALEGTQLLPDMNTMSTAVGLTILMLEVQPLSHKARLEGVNEQLGQNQAHPVKEGSAVAHTANDAPAQAEASDQSEKWPTPTPEEWKDVMLVATRAIILLLWSLTPQIVRSVPAKDSHMLTALLAHLLERLVIGHLPDLDLDMSMLFMTGQEPILRAITAGHREYTGLAVAMLSRLATDRTVATCRDSAKSIYTILCKSVCASMCFAMLPRLLL